MSPYSGMMEIKSSSPARNGRPKSERRGEASSQKATVRMWLYRLRGQRMSFESDVRACGGGMGIRIVYLDYKFLFWRQTGSESN